MQRPIFIFVGGINGSGKSTILDFVEKKRRDIQVIPGSTVFMKWLGIRNRDYEKLQSLPDVLALRELKKMMEFLVLKKGFARGIKVVLIDAHFVNIREGKAQKWVADWLGLMHGLILVKASAREILYRIERDTVRERGIFPKSSTRGQKIKLIAFFTKESEHVFKQYAKRHKVPKIIVRNERGRTAVATKAVLSFLKRIT